jgi:hypothetical protein
MGVETRSQARAFRQSGRRWLVLVVGAWTLCACATSGNVGSRMNAEAWGGGAIVVENNSWDRVTVYLSREGNPRRIGEVNALSNGTFPVRNIAILPDGRDAMLVARPLAGTPFRSDKFSFNGGTVVWTIENQTSLSHLSLR